MLVERPLLKLPIAFCADTLAREVEALPPSAWAPHPTGFIGNEAVRLVTVGGEESDAFEGPMGPTEHLLRCPYIMEVMAELGGTWGRSRLMGLAPGADVPGHVDIHYYWRTHLRIHIPVITNPGVTFTCGEDVVHMAAGECWVFDSFAPHGVRNRGDQKRIHLVLDTVGSEHHWDLIQEALAGTANAPRKLLPGKRTTTELAFEQINLPKVMSPWEIRCHIDYLTDQVVPDPALATVLGRLDRFLCAWATIWARSGADDEAHPEYRQLASNIRADLKSIDGNHLILSNGRTLYFALNQLVFANLITRAGDGDRTAPRQLAG